MTANEKLWQKLQRLLKLRRGRFDLVQAVLGLGILAIIASVSVRIMAGVKDTSTNLDANTTIDYGIEAVKDMMEQVPLYALIVIFGAIIGAVLMYLVPMGGRRL